MSTKRSTDATIEKAMADALKSVESREAEGGKSRSKGLVDGEAVSAAGDESASADGAEEVAEEAGLEAQLAEAQAELEARTEEIAALRDQMLRLAADFDNYRKRSMREMDEARKFGIERLARELLPILDNFDRALAHAQDSRDPVIEGVKMVARQFHDVLGSFGVKAFSAKDEMFDPERHEAISQAVVPGVEPGTVIEEAQRGYMIHDRLLRAAKVMIAAAPADEAEGDSQEDAPSIQH